MTQSNGNSAEQQSLFDRPDTGENPSSQQEGTNPGAFSQDPDIGGSIPFSSHDSQDMPEPSDIQADDWINDPNREPKTQLEHARHGTVTPEMKRISEKEDHLTPEEICKEVSAGRMIIPANINHLDHELDPMCIGRASQTKLNANLGASPVSSEIEAEVEKMRWATKWGADTVMDLSTGGPLDETREAIIRNSPVPVGTVPIYSMIVDNDLMELNYDAILKTLEKQAQQGVDYFTIHAGILKEHLPYVEDRLSGIVSRGGSLTAKWMIEKNKQNPMYDMFDEICDLMRQYDVSFSLGDGLRPGSLSDATDEAQLRELHTLGELTEKAWEKGVQVMIEGPGHIPFDQIEYNMKLERKLCHGAPFYVLGPLVTDVFPGYDHITSAIGATAAAYHGASMLCYVTPKEHLGLPKKEDVKEGCVSYKIAAHSADVALGIPGSRDWDDDIAKARAALNWEKQFDHAFDEQRARAFHDEDLDVDTDFCAMCGHDWCSVRISKDVQEFTSGDDEEFQPDQRAKESPGLTKEQKEFLEKRKERQDCHSEDVDDEETAKKIQDKLLKDAGLR